MTSLPYYQGFLANRILMPYINEAIVCLETVSPAPVKGNLAKLNALMTGSR